MSNINALLEKVKKDFNSKFSEKDCKLNLACDEPPITGLPLDNPLLEYVICREVLPFGRCVLTFGKKGSSKTSLFFDFAKLFQKHNGHVFWIETENAADLDYARDQGVDLTKMTLEHPSVLEEALTLIESIINNLEDGLGDDQMPVLICLDSIAGTMTNYEQDADVIGTSKPGEHAKLLANFYRKITDPLARKKCVFLALNQEREQIMGISFGPEKPVTMLGGMAPGFHSTLQFRLARIKDLTEKVEGEKDFRKYASIHKLTAVRNKVGVEGSEQQIEFTVFAKNGIDWFSGLVRMLGEYYPTFVKKSGGWYSWVIPDVTYNDPDTGEKKIIDTEAKMREDELASVINNSIQAKELIRRAFKVRPQASKEEVEKFDKEIKKKKKKEL